MMKSSPIALLRRMLNWPTLRSATKADLSQLVELELRVFAGDAWDRDRLEYYLNNPEGVVFLVLTFDQEIVSYVLVETSDEGETVAELNSIGTKEGYLRKGYARRLWEEVLEKLEAWGYTKVTLVVRESNRVARWWYCRLGFDVVDRIVLYYTNPEGDGLVMVKTLIEEQPTQESEPQ